MKYLISILIGILTSYGYSVYADNIWKENTELISLHYEAGAKDFHFYYNVDTKEEAEEKLKADLQEIINLINE